MTNKHIKLSVLLLSWTFNDFKMILKDDFTSCLQQEAVILLLESISISFCSQLNKF